MTKRPFSHAIIRFAATGFWSGCSPIMPGTTGSIAAFLLAVFLFPRLAPEYHVWTAFGLIAACTVFGLLFCRILLRSGRYGPEDKDPQEIVIDEFAGYFVSVIGITDSAATMLLALICFRLFDIVKPPPVNMLDSLPGAWGIMLDDLAAGVYAALVCRAVLSLW